MRRVVITGMGAISPIGNDVPAMWESIHNGRCGIDNITLFDASGFDVKVAAEVKNFNPGKYIKPLEQKKMDRFSQMAVLAGHESYNDAGLGDIDFDRERFSVMMGAGLAGTFGTESEKLLREGYNAVPKMAIPINLNNMAAANVAIHLKAYGTCVSVATACATGTDCIGQAFRNIRHGYSDIILAGGSEASINPLIIAGFASVGALTHSGNPERASIPFDAERSGFVMGEGAGALILEDYEHAKSRNARIHGELVAYGTSCDAYSLTAPDLSLVQGSRAIQDAIKEALIEKGKIDYINAHGTSTKLNDRYETAIIKKVFGNHSNKLAVSSTKSMTGHLLGAAGAIESIICIKALQEGFIPPTVNYQMSDEECDLDCVKNVGREKQMEYALTNSLGFGGHNSVLIFRKYMEE